MAQSCLRRSGSCLTRLCLLVLDLRYEPELRYSFSCAVYGIMFWIVPLFSTILSCCGSKRYCYFGMTAMRFLVAPLVTGPRGITSPHGAVNRARTCSALSSSGDWAPDVSVYS